MERTVQAYFETEVEYKGKSYTVIYGEHINGGWCCIPNWNIGCEMSGTDDVLYNRESLEQAGLESGAAKAIADKIYWVGHTLEERGLLPKYGRIGEDYLNSLLTLSKTPELEL